MTESPHNTEESGLLNIDDVVVAAANLLGARLGGEPELFEPVDLGGSGRSLVVRVRVAPNPFLADRSVVIKQLPADEGDGLTMSFVREVVAYQYTTTLPEDVRPGPMLLAYDINRRILVISDIGDGDNFADIFASGNVDARRRALNLLGHALGRVHAGTFDSEQSMRTLTNRMHTKLDLPAESHVSADHTIANGVGVGLQLLQKTNLDIPVEFMHYAENAQRRLVKGRHRAFTPFDLSPDNIVFSSRVHFLDYEWAGFRDVTFDVAAVLAGFPQYLEAEPLTDDEAQDFLNAWRSDLRGVWPGVDDDQRLHERVLTALVGWSLISVTVAAFGSPHAAQYTKGVPPVDIDNFVDAHSLDQEDQRIDLMDTFQALATFAEKGSEQRHQVITEFASRVVAYLEARE